MKLNELRFRLFFLVSLTFLTLLHTTSLRYSSNTSSTPFLTPHQHFGLIAILITGNRHKRLLMNFLTLELFTNHILLMRLRPLLFLEKTIALVVSLSITELSIRSPYLMRVLYLTSKIHYRNLVEASSTSPS